VSEDSLASPQDVEASASKAKPTNNSTVPKSSALVAPSTQQQEQQQQPLSRKRRPLLLFFPQHNQLQYLGAYRSILLSERYVIVY
jgi:hypothetical protein